MKRNRQCPKCDSLKVGYVPSLHDASEYQSDAHRVLGHATERSDGWIPVITQHRVGVIEGYVCGDCGYLEEYIREAAEADLDKIDGFVWLNAEASEGAYR